MPTSDTILRPYYEHPEISDSVLQRSLDHFILGTWDYPKNQREITGILIGTKLDEDEEEEDGFIFEFHNKRICFFDWCPFLMWRKRDSELSLFPSNIKVSMKRDDLDVRKLLVVINNLFLRNSLTEECILYYDEDRNEIRILSKKSLLSSGKSPSRPLHVSFEEGKGAVFILDPQEGGLLLSENFKAKESLTETSSEEIEKDIRLLTKLL